MIVIIRLKNLPWTADSSDIRRYFDGLFIPEGLIIIVGGVIGDAFIGFSTDEDARLAMMKDGGKIHKMQIKLLLSSKLEMTRVVKEARQENGTLLTTQAVIPLQPPSFPVIQQQPYQDGYNQIYYSVSSVAPNYHDPDVVPSNGTYFFNHTSNTVMPKHYQFVTNASNSNFPFSNAARSNLSSRNDNIQKNINDKENTVPDSNNWYSLSTRTMICPGPVRGNRAHMNRARGSPFERPLRRTETGTVGNIWR